MKTLTKILALLSFTLLISCSISQKPDVSTQPSIPGEIQPSIPEPEKRGIIYRFFHPEIMEGRPLWQKFMFWAGPGH